MSAYHGDPGDETDFQPVVPPDAWDFIREIAGEDTREPIDFIRECYA